MDAKSRADFVNSIATESKINCSNCNCANDPNARFCETCGSPLVQKAPALVPALETIVVEPVRDTIKADPFLPAKSRKTASISKPVETLPVYIEPENVFAAGLPEWNIEPPQVVVRRKSKR